MFHSIDRKCLSFIGVLPLLWLLIFLILLLFADTLNGAPPASDKLFPSAIFNTLSGDTWRTKNHRNRVLLVEFWSTDCVPCLKQVPQLRRIHGRWSKRDDLLLIGIPTDDKMIPVRRHIKRHRIKWPQLCAGDKSVSSFIAKQIGIKEITTPTFLVVDRKGKISHTIIGDLQKAKSLAEKLASPSPLENNETGQSDSNRVIPAPPACSPSAK